MVILDTDHLSLLHFPESAAAARIMSRLSSRGIQQAITTIITYEEQTRGWLKEIAGARIYPGKWKLTGDSTGISTASAPYRSSTSERKPLWNSRDSGE
jgi:hypothetical protein